MSADLIGVSSRVKFAEDRRWWTVRAEDERFVILTRQANFMPRGVAFYTIIDRARGVRGPCNLISQGWGDGFTPETVEQDATSLLRALNYHLEVKARLRAGEQTVTLEEPSVEVSYRNNVPVRIGAVSR